jgi:predicted sugar kinase
MLPALQRRDCRAFGEAVYQFGRMAGECFAPVQGGPFATSEISLLVEAIRGRGVSGVGQSSWGPTVFAICDSDVEARTLSYGLWSYLRGRYDLTIASPNNEGAVTR